MAEGSRYQRPYDPVCLQCNWYEDRAPPLKNGVLADYGDRSFRSTSMDYCRHLPRPPMVHLGEGFNASMITRGNIGSQSSIPRRQDDVEEEWKKQTLLHADYGKTFINTTHRDSYGYPTEVSGVVDRMRLEHTGRVPKADKNREMRFKGTSGAVGEWFYEKDDPKYDTACQRAWLYRPEAYIDYRKTQTLKKSGEALMKQQQSP